MAQKNDILSDAARISGIFDDTTVVDDVDIINDVVSLEDQPFIPAGKRANKGSTKRKTSESETPGTPLAKKSHVSNSLGARNQEKVEKIELQIIEAQRLVNPLKVQTFFNNLFKRNVRINGRGHRLSVEVSTTTERETIIGLSSVAEYRVKVFPNKLPSTSKMVILGVPEDIELDDIKRESGCLSAYRISKKIKGAVVLTTAVVLTFIRGKAPDRVKLAYLSFRTKPFVAEPLRCYKCCGFGHRAKDCRNAVKCSLCAKEHDWKECPDRDKERKERTRICASCGGGNHFTGDRKCPHFRTSVKLNQTVSQKGISYAAAMKLLSSEKKKAVASKVTPPTPLQTTSLTRPIPPTKKNKKPTEKVAAEQLSISQVTTTMATATTNGSSGEDQPPLHMGEEDCSSQKSSSSLRKERNTVQGVPTGADGSLYDLFNVAIKLAVKIMTQLDVNKMQVGKKLKDQIEDINSLVSFLSMVN